VVEVHIRVQGVDGQLILDLFSLFLNLDGSIHRWIYFADLGFFPLEFIFDGAQLWLWTVLFWFLVSEGLHFLDLSLLSLVVESRGNSCGILCLEESWLLQLWFGSRVFWSHGWDVVLLTWLGRRLNLRWSGSLRRECHRTLRVLFCSSEFVIGACHVPLLVVKVDIQ
jgi:hypothetical protein